MINLNIAKHHRHHKTIVIHPIFSLIILISFFIFQLGLRTMSSSDHRVLGTSSSLQQADIISLTNLERQSEGIEPVHPNSKLAQAAHQKAADMIRVGYWDHVSPNNREPWAFILDAGYDYHYAGENLAKDYNTAEALVKAWMNSPAHRANILNPNYQDIGIAVIQGQLNDKDTVLVVQMFGTEFTEADYQQAETRQELAPEGLTAISISPELTFLEQFFSNRFLATKIFTITVLMMIFFFVGFRVGHKKDPNYSQTKLSKEHWGHLLFIVALGILAWITKDGDIL